MFRLLVIAGERARPQKKMVEQAPTSALALGARTYIDSTYNTYVSVDWGRAMHMRDNK